VIYLSYYCVMLVQHDGVYSSFILSGLGIDGVWLLLYY